MGEYQFPSLQCYSHQIISAVVKQEEEKRGTPNYEHLDEDLHVLISVEDTEDRATLRLAKAVEKVKDLLQPVVRWLV